MAAYPRRIRGAQASVGAVGACRTYPEGIIGHRQDSRDRRRQGYVGQERTQRPQRRDSRKKAQKAQKKYGQLRNQILGNCDYRPKARIEFLPIFAASYPALFCDLCVRGYSRSVAKRRGILILPFFALFVPFCGYSGLILAPLG
jgi:hypothetical protein